MIVLILSTQGVSVVFLDLKELVELLLVLAIIVQVKIQRDWFGRWQNPTRLVNITKRVGFIESENLPI
jgi:hypothetical protein